MTGSLISELYPAGKSGCMTISILRNTQCVNLIHQNPFKSLQLTLLSLPRAIRKLKLINKENFLDRLCNDDRLINTALGTESKSCILTSGSCGVCSTEDETRQGVARPLSWSLVCICTAVRFPPCWTFSALRERLRMSGVHQSPPLLAPGAVLCSGPGHSHYQGLLAAGSGCSDLLLP